MLATTGNPQTGTEWVIEFKWNGMRGIAHTANGQLRLTARPRDSRPGNNITSTFPELAVITDLVGGGRSVVLDGEIVALADGRPSLHRLQRRMGANPTTLRVKQIPVFYQVFDLLALDDESLMWMSYTARRELLNGLGLAGKSAQVQVPPYFPDSDGWVLLDVARVHGLEGIVSKRRASRYQPGRRSRDWIKTKVDDHPLGDRSVAELTMNWEY